MLCLKQLWIVSWSSPSYLEPTLDYPRIIPELSLSHSWTIPTYRCVTLNQPWTTRIIPKLSLKQPRIILVSSLNYSWTNHGLFQDHHKITLNQHNTALNLSPRILVFSESQCIQSLYTRFIFTGKIVDHQGSFREIIVFKPIIYIFNSVLFCHFFPHWRRICHAENNF